MSIKLITGNNNFMAFNAMLKAKNQYIADSGSDSVDKIDVSEVELNTIKEALQAQSLFSMGNLNLVILSNASTNKLAVDFISDKFDQISENTDVIIFDQSLDKRSSLYKKLKQKSLIEDYPKLRPFELVNWAIDQSKELGFELSKFCAQRLVDLVGDDQWLLFNDLNKLSLVNGEITNSAIDEQVSATPMGTIFNMLDMLAAGNKDKVLGMMHELFDQGNDPIYLNTMLGWQFHNVLVVKSQTGLNDNELAKQFKISPYVLSKARGLANKLTMADIKAVFSILAQQDYDLKNVDMDKKLSQELVVVKILAILK